MSRMAGAHAVVWREDNGPVYAGKLAQDRIGGRTALVAKQRTGRLLRIASVGGLETVGELAERLVPLTSPAG